MDEVRKEVPRETGAVRELAGQAEQGVLWWLGHMEKMDEENLVKNLTWKVLKGNEEGQEWDGWTAWKESEIQEGCLWSKEDWLCTTEMKGEMLSLQKCDVAFMALARVSHSCGVVYWLNHVGKGLIYYCVAGVNQLSYQALLRRLLAALCIWTQTAWYSDWFSTLDAYRHT